MSPHIPSDASIQLVEAAAILLLTPFHGVTLDQQMWSERESTLRTLMGPFVYRIIEKGEEVERGERGEGGVGGVCAAYAVLGRVLRFLACESATPKNLFFSTSIGPVLPPSQCLLKVTFPFIPLLVSSLFSFSLISLLALFFTLFPSSSNGCIEMVRRRPLMSRRCVKHSSLFIVGYLTQ